MPRNAKKPRPVIHISEDGTEIPEVLVSEFRTNWNEITFARVKRKKQVLLALSLEVDGEKTEMMDAVSSLYSAACSEAETDGGGTFHFEGLAHGESENTQVQVFRRPISVKPDAEGNATAEDMDPTSAIIQACASTVERFGQLATQSVSQQIAQHDAYMSGITNLRKQLVEQAQMMRELDQRKFDEGQAEREHELQLARTAELGRALTSGFAMLGPQIMAAWASKSGNQEQGATPGPPPEGTPTPCAEAAELDRALSRLGDKEPEFRARFAEPHWELLVTATMAEDRDSFDSAIKALLIANEVQTMADALRVSSEWAEGMPADATQTLTPLIMSFAQRQTWPLAGSATAEPQGTGKASGADQEGAEARPG